MEHLCNFLKLNKNVNLFCLKVDKKPFYELKCGIVAAAISYTMQSFSIQRAVNFIILFCSVYFFYGEMPLKDDGKKQSICLMTVLFVKNHMSAKNKTKPVKKKMKINK